MLAGTVPRPLAVLPISASGVTALAFASHFHVPHAPVKSALLQLAIGLNTGQLELWSFDCSNHKYQKGWESPDDLRHCAAVRRLAWRPCQHTSQGYIQQLASCSSDHCVKILNVCNLAKLVAAQKQHCEAPEL